MHLPRRWPNHRQAARARHRQPASARCVPRGWLPREAARRSRSRSAARLTLPFLGGRVSRSALRVPAQRPTSQRSWRVANTRVATTSASSSLRDDKTAPASEVPPRHSVFELQSWPQPSRRLDCLAERKSGGARSLDMERPGRTVVLRVETASMASVPVLLAPSAKRAVLAFAHSGVVFSSPRLDT